MKKTQLFQLPWALLNVSHAWPMTRDTMKFPLALKIFLFHFSRLIFTVLPCASRVISPSGTCHTHNWTFNSILSCISPNVSELFPYLMMLSQIGDHFLFTCDLEGNYTKYFSNPSFPLYFQDLRITPMFIFNLLLTPFYRLILISLILIFFKVSLYFLIFQLALKIACFLVAFLHRLSFGGSHHPHVPLLHLPGLLPYCTAHSCSTQPLPFYITSVL